MLQSQSVSAGLNEMYLPMHILDSYIDSSLGSILKKSIVGQASKVETV